MFIITISKEISMISLFIFVFIIALLSLSFHSNYVVSAINNRVENPIYKGNENESKIALECNVVWGTEFVPQMLNILKEKSVRITFFIGGKWAENNPELLKDIVSNNHEIGNHGYDHKMHSQLNNVNNKKEILKTQEIISNICGIRTDLFAPPSGDFNDLTLNVVHELGYKTILWSIDTIDWKREGKDIIIRRVLQKPHNGAFILMHPTKYTVEALPEMIDGLRGKGFSICTISELIKKD